ncbi:MAG: hypothetical protein PHI49_12545 [Halothiobacillaceae bacterium]|nr:hypothetical protein [Halothiobacillaceae bacterium]
MQRRKMAGLILLGATSVFLAGCGGGSDGDGGADSLWPAYQATAQGMSFAEVRGLVGFDVNERTEDLGEEVLYTWQVGKGTENPEFLTVQFKSGRAAGKVYGSTNRHESEFW